MNTIGEQYGDWLSTMKWDYIVTIRPHYKMTMFSSDKKMEHLFKYKNIERLFYASEKDRDSPLNHLHLILKTNTSLTRNTLAKLLGVNPKVVGYFQKVESPKSISHYCTKNLSKVHTHFNFYGN